MSNKCPVPFNGTKEQEQMLQAVIANHKDQDGPLMPVLQEAQEIYGYLPIEVQKMISEGLDIPLEHIYGVVTFYAQFSLAPKGKYKIGVCMGTACYVKGSGDILNKIKEITADGKFSLEATRCIGACGLAPVLTINEEVYGRLVVGDIPEILKKYMD